MLNAFLKILRNFGLEYYGKYYSIYQGTVVDVKDPEGRGRLIVSVPDVYNTDVPDYWALPKGMFNGNQTGLFAIPTVNDVVWVTFQKGDPRYPVWEYGYFGDGDVPTEVQFDSDEPKSIVLKSLGGHKLHFDDKDELIRLTDSHGNNTEFNEEGIFIKSNKHQVEIDDSNDLIRITDTNGNIVEMNSTGVSVISDKISLGSLDGSAEPGTLGDTLMDLLNEFRDDLGNIGTITTSTGVTATINTSPMWSALTAKWDAKFEQFKSKVVTLD